MSPKNGAGCFAPSRLRRGCPRKTGQAASLHILSFQFPPTARMSPKNGAGCFAPSRLRRGCPRKTGQAASLHPAYGEDVPEKRGRLLRSTPPTARMSPKNGAGCFAPSRLRRGCPRKTGQAASLHPAYGEDVPEKRGRLLRSIPPTARMSLRSTVIHLFLRRSPSDIHSVILLFLSFIHSSVSP